ncbi:pyridoxal-phosphate dependent enzyme [Halovenus sp. WSH3]|uniref:Pyridoxal-phosphate dependent enzyme n=1 Tax=Halovenus carboxidivorans TaxID=2692199 RepID=A0A6B0SWN4_9EURY|nr:pyridoxal-phosphate dependent enzyme [Halovenus carboxidivorans]MXR50098.1 pyridoxal-phosphate dependent enzyme [Halovenus carboxidivorans]
MSAETTYVCPSCGSRFEPAADRWRCDCGHPLRFADPPAPEADSPPAPDRDRGLWAFEELLAVDRRVTLGEGWTPLVDAPERAVEYKLDWLFPTGSFKDRGAATTISHALELGVDRVVEDSSGNAGAAIATYAARAGIDAEIFVPADAKPGKLRAIERTGATVRRIEGDRAAVTEACIDAVEGGDPAWYASHAWNPAFFEGTATVAYELAAQRGWTAPDAVVTPLGHGTLFLGAYRGFARLHEAGWIDGLPRLYGVQAAGVAPIVESRHGEAAAAGENSLADGIQITDPVQRSAITEAVDRSGGDVLAVDAETTEAEYDRLHRQGLYTEPTCAVAPAAMDSLRERGAVAPDEDVVVALTGSGLKT